MKQSLKVSGIHKSFSNFELKNINFSVEPGIIMGLIGSNGSGKTTTLKLILNLLEIDSGDIKVFGLDSIQDEIAIKQRLGVVMDNSFYPDNWTINEVEKAVSKFYEKWDHNEFRSLVTRFELPDKTKQGQFSRGMKIKLMLACAFSHDARLLILDEPTSGLDSIARNELLDILQQYVKDGQRSVIFSTHITADLERIANQITFINRGKLFYSGNQSVFLNEYGLIRGENTVLQGKYARHIIGTRVTGSGFEGLIPRKDLQLFPECGFQSATLDDIIYLASKREA